MPEENEKGEMPAAAPEQPEGETPQAVPSGPDGQPFDPERAMATIEKLREFEKKAKQLEKKVTDYEQAEEKRKKAAMTEMERVQAALAEAQEKLAIKELIDQKRAIAREVGLPEELAMRIQGETVEEMKEDAETLKAIIPEPQDPKKPKIRATNPPNSPPQVETDEEKRRRLFG